MEGGYILDSFLDQLYEGTLRPLEQPRTLEQQYASASGHFERLCEALRDSSGPEQRQLLLQLEEEHHRLLNLLERDTFIQGVRTGARLMAEALC